MKFCIIIAAVAFMTQTFTTCFSATAEQVLDPLRHNNSPFKLRKWKPNKFKGIMYAAGGTLQCDLCQMMVTDVRSLMKGRQLEVQNLLDSLCQDLPTEYQVNCTSIIDSYLPIGFASIDNMTPVEVCELLTMCTSDVSVQENDGGPAKMSVAVLPLQRFSKLGKIQKRRIKYFHRLVGEDYLCEACEVSIGFIHNTVARNYTWDAVANFSAPLCGICSVPNQCATFFWSLARDVNDFANKYLDPVQDCQILGFCPVDEEKKVKMNAEEEQEEDEEVVPRIVETVIPVQTQLRSKRLAATRSFFGLPGLSGNIRFPGLSGRLLIRCGRRRRTASSVLGGQEGANQVPCGFIGEEVQTFPVETECRVCRFVASVAEDILENSEENMKQGLSVILDDVCNSLPDRWRSECDNEATNALPHIYQAALKLMNPDHLCIHTIGICSQ